MISSRGIHPALKLQRASLFASRSVCREGSARHKEVHSSTNGVVTSLLAGQPATENVHRGLCPCYRLTRESSCRRASRAGASRSTTFEVLHGPEAVLAGLHLRLVFQTGMRTGGATRTLRLDGIRVRSRINVQSLRCLMIQAHPHTLIGQASISATGSARGLPSRETQARLQTQ